MVTEITYSRDSDEVTCKILSNQQDRIVSTRIAVILA
jgi:hypothetical protein